MEHRRLLTTLFGLVLCASGHALVAQSSPEPHREFGSGSPIFIVLHGGPGAPHDYLLPEWQRLEDFGTVLFYDQRGCGSSKDLPGPYGWKDHVTDLDVLISKHSDGKPVVLAASSWGAQLALLYALEGEMPIEGIVLSGYPGWPGFALLMPSEQPIHLWTRIDSLERGLLADLARPADTLTSGDGRGGEAADSIVIARFLPTVCPEARTGVLESYSTVPPFQALLDVRVPVLIVSGDGRESEGASAMALVAVLHHARHVVIRDSGHDPWAADPKAFFGAVQSFVQELGFSGELTPPGGR